MKRNILEVAVLAAILTSGAFSACSDNPKETTAVATETQTVGSRAEDTTTTEAEITQASVKPKEIVVGVSPAPHVEIPNAAKEVLTSKSYELRTAKHTDYVQSNNTLDSGDPDANYFQHEPHLDSLNKQNGTNLVSVSATHYEPFGIYTGKTAFLEELSDRVAVLVPNDVSNKVRTPLLLEVQGLIKLKDGVGLEVTKNDITESTRSLDIVGLEAAQLPRSISDDDIVVINGNYAIKAGFRVSDVLATEDSQSLAVVTYSNVVAVREGEESSGTTETLAEALTSPEVKQFMEKTYEGTAVLLF